VLHDQINAAMLLNASPGEGLDLTERVARRTSVAPKDSVVSP
jgi:hypothetical protein